MDMDKILQKAIEKQAKETIKKEVNNYMDGIDIKNVVDGLVESELHKKFWDNDNSLEHYIIESTKNEMFGWFADNIYKEDMMECIVIAFSEKIKTFTVDEMADLFSKIKNKEK